MKNIFAVIGFIAIFAVLIRHGLRHSGLASKNRTSNEWSNSPTGCCVCGTGGPFYFGKAPALTRYLYGNATEDGDGTSYDWSTCSKHPQLHDAPTVDYGKDIIVSFAQSEADFAEKLTKTS